MADSLTHRQREVLAFIEQHIATHGIAPTLREIGAALSIRSTNGVSDHLRLLAKKGAIKLLGGAKSRAIVLGTRATVDADAVIADLRARLAKATEENAALRAELGRP